MTSANDPWRNAERGGWKIIDASQAGAELTLECDAVIVGTGAGGGIAADTLSAAGLSVIMIEEGPLRTSADFHMRETEAYPELYQESAARKTRDKAINILQGRCVGGGTTVNWTSSFRTPESTLEHWRTAHGIAGFASSDLAPWFAQVDGKLGVAPWAIAPNANNAVLARGAARLGIATETIARNVRGCANLGYCGMGCPLDAKQSMLVTGVPAALARGAVLVTRTRALDLVQAGDRVSALRCVALDPRGIVPAGRMVTVRARAFVVAAGAIGTPALLLRSRVPDPHEVVGKRTFLHPVIMSAAHMPETVDAFSGAPQSVCTDHFLLTPVDGPMGYKLEAPPVHPVLAAITLPNHGAVHAQWMRALPNMQVLLALLRDGFHPESAGGRVQLRDDGTPVLDYPLNSYVWEGARRALLSMAEIQFAAGATRVMPVHGNGTAYASWADAKRAIAGFDLAPLVTPVVSAHVMGGAPMGPDPRRAVIDTTGRHHHLANLHVIDGSIFPTSIGANPQLSIYAIAARLAAGLATSLRRTAAA
jgi:choline dehydrogenase-like flavoprotein